MPLDPSTWSPIDSVANISLGYHGPYSDFSSETPATQYPVDRYRPSLHLFEFHSWGFTSGPPNLGFGLISNDKMGLMDFNASVLYNTNEGTTGFRTGVSYNRFFPVLDFSFSDRNRSLQFAAGTENWNEHTATAGFHIPLNLSRGYYITGLSIGAEIQSINLQGGSLVPLTYGLSFSHVRQRSARDLAPVWAQQLRFTYSQTPWANAFTGNFLSAGGAFCRARLGAPPHPRVRRRLRAQRGQLFLLQPVAFSRAAIPPSPAPTSPNLAPPTAFRCSIPIGRSGSSST